mmetsp:Transcript_79683/g.225574  ORF Transcript_79683/g.225574 Transcript_79683/m.225574 type:complete len:251 (+) Transcript_79683:838-1590(+)
MDCRGGRLARFLDAAVLRERARRAALLSAFPRGRPAGPPVPRVWPLAVSHRRRAGGRIVASLPNNGARRALRAALAAREELGRVRRRPRLRRTPEFPDAALNLVAQHAAWEPSLLVKGIFETHHARPEQVERPVRQEAPRDGQGQLRLRQGRRVVPYHVVGGEGAHPRLRGCPRTAAPAHVTPAPPRPGRAAGGTNQEAGLGAQMEVAAGSARPPRHVVRGGAERGEEGHLWRGVAWLRPRAHPRRRARA